MSDIRMRYLSIGGHDLSDVISTCHLFRGREVRDGVPGLATWRVGFHLQRHGDAVAYLFHHVGVTSEIEIREQNAPRSKENPALIGNGFLAALGDTPFVIEAASDLTEATQ